MKRINPAVLLALVVLTALLLRLWGISADLPYIYHPDEPVPLEISLRMFKTGDMSPHSIFWHIYRTTSWGNCWGYSRPPRAYWRRWKW